MRPILSIGLIALLLCTAGCTNPVSKIIDKLTDDEPATSQQSTTTSTPAQSNAQTPAPTQPAAQAQTAPPAVPQQPAPTQPQTPAPAPAVDTQLQRMTPAPPNTHGQIRGTEVRMRGGPSTDDEILGYFDNREYVSILGSMDGWYHVRRANGEECWVSGDFCKQL